MRFSASLSIISLALILGMAEAHAVELASFRVFYTFLPSRIDQASTTVPIDGALAYEARGSRCLGYTVDSRMGNRYADEHQGQRFMDLEATTFESADGADFEVNQTQYVNKQADEPERISVKRPDGASAANGEIKGAKPATFNLKPEILFPTGHEIKLLAAAEKGITRDESYVYDGSDGTKFYRAFTFIGKKRVGGSFTPDAQNPQTKVLQNLASWPFSIGYYPGEDPKADTPVFQASFNMYENGITTEMLFDYGTYAMKGTLQKLDLLATEPCDSTAAPMPPKPEVAVPQ